ncbi:MAG TPA: FAD-dependent monooxygenase [Pseudonocardiaceae bacterium]|jgi:2-polyprenyl-6-methoxyphenol hydroxylase-like FAD-dependent oxidoreductase|nr:FAD-dependent monooxygenase [Pseudonocardiaceae bacterium]
MELVNRNVLICGASIAGPTLAYWLRGYGFRPTVVERAPRPRPGGYPIDVRGQAVRVAERMGVLPELRRAVTDTDGLAFVDARNRTVSRLDLRALRAKVPTHDLELPRGDLAETLYAATRNDVEYLFGDSIRDLSPDPDGVTVGFASGNTRRFDLVVGADGLHSTVRRLTFGPEPGFVRHLGWAVAVATVPGSRPSTPDGWLTMYNSPGRLAGLGRWRAGQPPVAIFMYRTDGEPTRDKETLISAFRGEGWQVPELLTEVAATDDFYFDTVSQVHLPEWTRDRVALVGDAAYCPALLSGAGSSLAMIGAYLLAGELNAAGGEHRTAFAAYERALRPAVAAGQAGVRQSAGMMIPGSPLAIWRRNQLTRLALPLATVTSLVRRHSPAGPPLTDYAAPARPS